MYSSEDNMRPGILLVSNYSNLTGYAWNNIYRLFEHIAVESKACGLAPWVSFADYQPPLDWSHASVFVGVLELPPSPRSFSELWRWVRAIKQHGIRYLYLTDQALWSFQYMLFRLAGIRKIVVHCRISVPDPRPATPEQGVRGGLKWLACHLPLIQATRIYAVSDFVRNRLIHKARMPARRVVTILNGVDLERFAPRPFTDRDSRPLQIFCGGRATVHKGIHLLIEAVVLLRDRYNLSGFVVRYAGDGPDMRAFSSQVAANKLDGLFEFLGELPCTDALVADADIVVVPSVWGDACPSAISEALASGKPLVATRVGGVPELVGDGEVAIMVEPGKSEALAAALADLVLNPAARAHLAQGARRRAEQALDQKRYYAEMSRQLADDLFSGSD